MIFDKIDYVDLVLENCDYYRIYIDDVRSIILDHVYEDVGVNFIGQCWNHKIAEYAHIELANKDFKTKWQSDFNIDTEVTFIERMATKDITSIVIAGKNDNGKLEEHQFYIRYKEKDEGVLGSSNLWQANMFTEDYISIEIQDWDKKYSGKITTVPGKIEGWNIDLSDQHE